jgi:hypothetical protein
MLSDGVVSWIVSEGVECETAPVVPVVALGLEVVEEPPVVTGSARPVVAEKAVVTGRLPVVALAVVTTVCPVVGAAVVTGTDALVVAGWSKEAI